MYTQVYFEVNAQQGTTEQRYVRLNLDMDMVDIGTSEFRYFEHIASDIKWFRFERENGDESFYHIESQELRNFINAKEIHVVCADGFWMWGGVINDRTYPWPCTDEKLVFIDPTDGRVARGLELEEICQQIVDMPTGEELSSEESSWRGTVISSPFLC